MKTSTLVFASLGVLFAIFLVVGLVLSSRGMAGGRLARLFRIGRLSARLSSSWLGASLRRLFASQAGRARIDAARRQADAALVVETMGQMKGALMKLGQMLSFVSDDVPEEYRTALASLQAAAPPMDLALLRDVAERELGMPLERAFARFDEKPLASASIGQVHRAQLPSGEEVVVKIQYPGVARAIESDLKNVAFLYQFAGLMFPSTDTAAVVEELRGRILEELDYVHEARSQRAFADLYADHPFIRIPRVIDSHSTAHVLTSEYLEGRRFADIIAAEPELKNRYSEILWRFIFGSIIRYGVFNGDPHPGNYLFDDQGRVIFLDFGCVKYFQGDLLRDWRALILAHFADDPAAFRRRLVALHFIREDAPVDMTAVFDFFAYFYEPFRHDRVYTFNREYNSKSLRMVFRPEGRFAPIAKQFNMPRDFVFVNRIQWGVFSILAQLGATGNWHRIHTEYLLHTEPSTELGRLDHEHHARWLAARGLNGAVSLTQAGVKPRVESALADCA